MNTSKIRNYKGFTLIEAVVSLLTVTIVTSLFMTLVFFVKDTYEDLETNSEAQILSATLTNYVQDELRYATFVSEIEGVAADASTNFTYYSKTLGEGMDCKLISRVDNGEKGDNKEKLYISYIEDGATLYHPLVGKSSYVFKLQANLNVRYDSTSKTFHVKIKIYTNKYQDIITSEFTVDPLNKVDIE